MKHLLLASLITLLAFGTACGQAPEPEPIANDGIQVHGHWTVTVSNPDGTVDAVHEFENALNSQMNAADFLTALLVEDVNTEPDEWYISLGSINENVDCKEEVDQNPYSSNDDKKLFLPAIVGRDVTTDGSPASLSAVCTVEGVQDPESPNSVIKSVSTKMNTDKIVKVYCGIIMGGQPCSFSSTSFTKHTLQNPIEPKIDQIFSFNVILSFS